MTDISRERRAGEVAMRRRAGMDAGKRVEMNEHFFAASDLRARCSGCGNYRVGSLVELRDPCVHCGRPINL